MSTTMPATALLESDFYGFQQQLTEQERASLGQLRQYLEQEVRPIADEYWARAEFPMQVIAPLAELGMYGPGVPLVRQFENSAVYRGWAALELGRVDASVATFIGVQGIALLINPIPTGLFAASATETLSKTVAGIPIMFLVCVVIAILAELTLRRGRLGLALRAVGSNEAAAHRMGVNVGLTRISAYVLASSFAALAAMMLAVQIGTGDATAGQSYTLQSISAVVLGGASIYGGRGSFLGAVLGALAFARRPKRG